MPHSEKIKRKKKNETSKRATQSEGDQMEAANHTVITPNLRQEKIVHNGIKVSIYLDDLGHSPTFQDGFYALIDIDPKTLPPKYPICPVGNKGARYLMKNNVMDMSKVGNQTIIVYKEELIFVWEGVHSQ